MCGYGVLLSKLAFITTSSSSRQCCSSVEIFENLFIIYLLENAAKVKAQPGACFDRRVNLFKRELDAFKPCLNTKCAMKWNIDLDSKSHRWATLRGLQKSSFLTKCVEINIKRRSPRWSTFIRQLIRVIGARLRLGTILNFPFVQKILNYSQNISRAQRQHDMHDIA